ncbi:aminotransferase class III-fold pyridoxal phosphate-dependent enzyme [Rhodoligotrophos ferricapiens]|uniref:aminotransferase class III-fold pyridoxal phosphate-dependent enzyme n=1 Tax=Rhodoligotrophos ferricapiens TaxID=3069264 RepID=UPI00315D0029
MQFLKLNPPCLDEAEAARLIRLFPVEGELRPLYSERDQNFLVTGKAASYVLKIVSSQDDAASIDMQLQALAHIAEADPTLPVPRLQPAGDGDNSVSFTSEAGSAHRAFLLSYLPGIILNEAPLSSALLHNHGQMVARLGRALAGFFHPAAGRQLLWDLRQLPEFAAVIERVEDSTDRALLDEIVSRFAAHVGPRLKTVRAQIIHGDASAHNVLVDSTQQQRIAGIVDFGDLYHGPLVSDLAVAIADVLFNRDGTPAQIATIVSGYHSVTPVAPEEVDLLYDLISARLALSYLIAVYRRTETPGREDYNAALAEDGLAWLKQLKNIGGETLTRTIRAGLGHRAGGTASSAAGAPVDMDSLRRRRDRVMGPRMRLFYENPLHMVRGEGVWLFDATGRRFLDVYNNVPHVGHCHPHVVEAIARQAAILNTNTRYLGEQVISLAERLGATLPGDLRICAFVNSGSEANDVAWRMAKAYTGNGGGIMMQAAYHGITDAIDAFSPAERRGGQWPAHMRAIMPPDGYRGSYRYGEPDLGARYAADTDKAIASLAEAGLKPAAFMVDSTFLTNGVLEAPQDYLATVFAKVRAAGGLCIADEVQAGFGRMGRSMWGHQTYGVVPDIVTIGKPAGNGHPLGVVITRPEIMDALLDETSFFSTFGGNNVSAAAGLAVLDVIEQEHLIENSTAVGAYLKDGLKGLMARHEIIGDVRGHGLVIGVELVRDRASLEPAREETARVVNGMRDRGVLIGSEGQNGCVLKIRPPIVFAREHAEIVIETLDQVLASL